MTLALWNQLTLSVKDMQLFILHSLLFLKDFMDSYIWYFPFQKKELNPTKEYFLETYLNNQENIMQQPLMY